MSKTRTPQPLIPGLDYAQFARTASQERFVGACPFLFLIAAALPASSSSAPGGPPTVLPLRKSRDELRSIITVGRGPNNDIVLDDPSLSPFHACFRFRGHVLELVDAGSMTGTFLGGKRVPQRRPVPVSSGDRVGFGSRWFVLADAAACWELVRKPR